MKPQVYYFDLSKNILLFSKRLRERKVGVTVGNVLDALRGTSLIDLQRKEDFYNLLKSNFVSHREELAPFDELFGQFWSFEEATLPSLKKSIQKKLEPSQDKEEEPSELQKQGSPMLMDWSEEKGEEERQTEEKELAQYSPEEILGQKDFGNLATEELARVREFVSHLSRRIAQTISRRWKRGRTGDHLDFRKSIRQSLKYGGELVELRMRKPKPKPIRLILLGDVSGSMDVYCQFFLLLMYGLQNGYPHCETFVFSTRLSHITSLMKRRAFGEALQLLSKKVSDWSGGTNIGAALHQLHQQHTDLLNPRKTVLLIFSDGWDRGETQLLDLEMENMKRQVKRLIWLNPLLGSPNYQPLCKGMSTALPYLDHFVPCHNFASLKKLSSLIAE
jgi:uncharacterized protein